jgi:DNA-binding transcriptional MerR regulator
VNVSSTELARMAGISYRQLDYWSRRGFISTKHPGYGHQRQWDDSEADRTLMLARLVRAGFELEWASRHVTCLLANGRAHVAPGMTLAAWPHG